MRMDAMGRVDMDSKREVEEDNEEKKDKIANELIKGWINDFFGFIDCIIKNNKKKHKTYTRIHKTVSLKFRFREISPTQPHMSLCIFSRSPGKPPRGCILVNYEQLLASHIRIIS